MLIVGVGGIFPGRTLLVVERIKKASYP